MTTIQRHTLANGLRLVHHEDKTTRMVAVNIVYNVGARDEDENHTGFAHLFEHLMFGGSVHIADYDTPMQLAGGENNAWTNNDITNYYLTLPAQNVETAFWLESDRMMELDFNPHSLEVQRQVVTEEFKQRCLNRPYGDTSHLIRQLAYTTHPYRWPTIGRDISHIANATMEEVKDFFFRFYAPNNAVMAVTGNIPFDETVRLVEKWFADIPRRDVPQRHLPKEPVQTAPRRMEVERDVPVDAIYMAFHMCDRLSPEYYVCDMLSDILSNGSSSRLEQELVQKRQVCSYVEAFITGSVDDGLFFVSAKPVDGVSLQQVEQEIWTELRRLQDTPLAEEELEKVKNRFESDFLISNVNYQNVAANLAYFETVDRAEAINEQVGHYRSVTAAQLQQTAQRCFVENNCSTLYYRAKK